MVDVGEQLPRGRAGHEKVHPQVELAPAADSSGRDRYRRATAADSVGLCRGPAFSWSCCCSASSPTTGGPCPRALPPAPPFFLPPPSS